MKIFTYPNIITRLFERVVNALRLKLFKGQVYNRWSFKKHKLDTYIISHGGVASEALTRELSIIYPNSRVGPRRRPFKGAFVHCSEPSYISADKGIYLFGDVYNAICSQIGRHPDNPRKLRNDESYPLIHTFEDMHTIKNDDPFGISGQFFKFTNFSFTHPVMYLNYTGIHKSVNSIASFSGQSDFKWNEKKRTSSVKSLSEENLKYLDDCYGGAAMTMSELQPCFILYPAADVANVDVEIWKAINFERYDWLLSSILQAFLELPSLPAELNLKLLTPRIKHFMHVADRWFIVNLRLDTLSENGDDVLGCSSYILLFEFEIGSQDVIQNMRVITHPSIIGTLSGEGGKYVGPEDPRVHILNGSPYITFNGPIVDINGAEKRRLFVYDVKAQTSHFLEVNGPTSDIEKNWIIFSNGPSTFLLYSINPLQIYVKRANEWRFDLFSSSICSDREMDEPYGGSDLLMVLPNVFFGIGHSRDPWRAIPYVLDVDRMIVHWGEVIELPTMRNLPAWRGKSVQYPYGIRIDDDKFHIYVEYEDKCPVRITFNSFVAFKYISKLIHGIRSTDKVNSK